MYAHRLARICRTALSVCLSLEAAAAASLPGAARPEVAVSFKSDTQIPPRIISSLRSELETMMRSAGYHLDWNATELANLSSFSIDVELRGACAVASHASAGQEHTGVPLASSAVRDGRILPRTWVNCDSVQALLAPHLASQPAARRDYLTGRAVARLIAHEFYHVLSQSRLHASAGIARDALNATDLLQESASFEEKTLRRMVPPMPASQRAASLAR
jgi:hypothetical protein